MLELKMKSMPSQVIIDQLRSKTLSEEERVIAISILKMRNRDVAEFTQESACEVLPVKTKDLSVMDGEELFAYITEEGDDEVLNDLGRFVEDLNLTANFVYTELDPLNLEKLRLIAQKKGYEVSNVTQEVDLKANVDKESTKRKRKSRKRQRRPKNGTKALRIYRRLMDTDDSLYKISNDLDTYYSVVRGILDRYNVKRPAERAIEEDLLD